MKIAELPDVDRQNVIDRLTSSLERAKAGEMRGVIIFEVVDKDTFLMGAAGLGSTYAAIGMLEEIKHQLLAEGGEAPPEWIE